MDGGEQSSPAPLAAGQVNQDQRPASLDKALSGPRTPEREHAQTASRELQMAANEIKELNDALVRAREERARANAELAELRALKHDALRKLELLVDANADQAKLVDMLGQDARENADALARARLENTELLERTKGIEAHRDLTATLLARLKSKNQTLGAELQVSRARWRSVAERLAEIDGLREAVTGRDERLKALAGELEDALARSRADTEVIVALRAEGAKQDDRLERLERDRARNAKALKAERERTKALTAELAGADSFAAKSQIELERVRAQLAAASDAADARVAGFRKEITEARSAGVKAASALAAADERMESQRRELLALGRSKSESEAALKAARGEFAAASESAQARVAALSNELEEAQSAGKTATSALAAADERLESQQRELLALGQSKSESEAALKAARGELAAASESAQARIAALSKDLGEARSAGEKAASALAAADERMESQQRELLALAQSKSESEAALKAARGELAAASESAQARVAALSNELEEARSAGEDGDERAGSGGRAHGIAATRAAGAGAVEERVRGGAQGRAR